MDLKTLTDEELRNHLIEVMAEQDRRKALATIPGKIADLTAQFMAGGGNPADLP